MYGGNYSVLGLGYLSELLEDTLAEAVELHAVQPANVLLVCLLKRSQQPAPERPALTCTKPRGIKSQTIITTSNSYVHTIKIEIVIACF